MTNKTFTYHAATKEFVENKVYKWLLKATSLGDGEYALSTFRAQNLLLNATSMNLPDEDDGKEFVEGVDFLSQPMFSNDEHGNKKYRAVSMPKTAKQEMKIAHIGVGDTKESEDELFWELLEIFKRPFAEKNNIEKAKQHFTIKRK